MAQEARLLTVGDEITAEGRRHVVSLTNKALELVERDLHALDSAVQEESETLAAARLGSSGRPLEVSPDTKYGGDAINTHVVALQLDELGRKLISRLRKEGAQLTKWTEDELVDRARAVVREILERPERSDALYLNVASLFLAEKLNSALSALTMEDNEQDDFTKRIIPGHGEDLLVGRRVVREIKKKTRRLLLDEIARLVAVAEAETVVGGLGLVPTKSG